jgi:DRG Family Regulatory Proteins, Tma46/RWD domain
VEYPKRYPVEKVTVRVTRGVGLTRKVLDELQGEARKIAVSSVGDVCVFDIAAEIQEKLIEYNKPEKTIYEEMMERKAEQNGGADEEDEAAENNKDPDDPEIDELPPGADWIVPGTLVTEESFTDWLEKFKKEKEEIKVEVSKNQKPSGRQIFERNLTLGMDKDADDNKDDKDSSEVFWFNEDAYLDEDFPDDFDDDDDLPDDHDLDDDDEEDNNDQDDTQISVQATNVTQDDTVIVTAVDDDKEPEPNVDADVEAEAELEEAAAAKPKKKPKKKKKARINLKKKKKASA